MIVWNWKNDRRNSGGTLRRKEKKEKEKKEKNEKKEEKKKKKEKKPQAAALCLKQRGSGWISPSVVSLERRIKER